MAPTQHITLLLSSLLPTIYAWQYSTTNVELSSPPPLNSGNTRVDGVTLANNSDSPWPCINYPVPDNVVRTPFPISGGKFSFTQTNSTPGSLKDNEYIADLYLGQISLGNQRYSGAEFANTSLYGSGFYGIDTLSYRDFASGPDCSPPFNDVADVVGNALNRDVSLEEVVGMNATIGVRIVLFGNDPTQPPYPYGNIEDYNIEEMQQCGYITFTDADLTSNADAGYCNGGRFSIGSNPSPASSSASPASTIVSPGGPMHPTHPSHPIPTPENSTNVGYADTGSRKHTIAIGTGVGVSMGVSALILVLAFLYLRRRKARKHSGTIGPHVVVARQQEHELVESGKGEKKKNDVESSASSTHSEPLPPYTAARDSKEASSNAAREA